MRNNSPLVNAWIFLNEDEPAGTNYNSSNSSYKDRRELVPAVPGVQRPTRRLLLNRCSRMTSLTTLTR